MPVRCQPWKEASAYAQLQKLETKKLSDTQTEVKTTYKLPNVEGTATINYVVSGDGQVKVDYRFEAKKKDLAEIPRIGLKLQLPKELQNLHYYGRGPQENYIDRNTASFVGLYKSKATDQYFAYGRPQENGHKTDVRWLQLTNQSGLGLKVVAIGNPIEFNVLHFSIHDLDPGTNKKGTTSKDVEEGDFVELNIDHKMMGVGGDDSWGAKARLPFLYYADKPYSYSFAIVPVR